MKDDVVDTVELLSAPTPAARPTVAFATLRPRTSGFESSHVRVNPGRNQLCYSISVSGIAPATLAHIHEAAVGVSGPVVVDLRAPTSGTSQGCVTITRELAKEIIQNSSDYYVNVHNAEFRGGAVRGQLGR